MAAPAPRAKWVGTTPDRKLHTPRVMGAEFLDLDRPLSIDESVRVVSSMGRQPSSTQPSSPVARFGTEPRLSDAERRARLDALNGAEAPSPATYNNLPPRRAISSGFGTSRDLLYSLDRKKQIETPHIGPGSYDVPLGGSALRTVVTSSLMSSGYCGAQGGGSGFSSQRFSTTSWEEAKKTVPPGGFDYEKDFLGRDSPGPGCQEIYRWAPDESPTARPKSPEYSFGAPRVIDTEPTGRPPVMTHADWVPGPGTFGSPGPVGTSVLEPLNTITFGYGKRKFGAEPDSGDFSAYAGKDISVPAPGAYEARSSIGHQPSSFHKSLPAFGFGSLPRFAPLEKERAPQRRAKKVRPGSIIGDARQRGESTVKDGESKGERKGERESDGDEWEPHGGRRAPSVSGAVGAAARASQRRREAASQTTSTGARAPPLTHSGTRASTASAASSREDPVAARRRRNRTKVKAFKTKLRHTRALYGVDQGLLILGAPGTAGKRRRGGGAPEFV